MQFCDRSSLARGNVVNPYQVLGISESASAEEIKAAYESRAKRYHPESGGDAWALRQVQEAYDAISGLQVKRTPVPDTSRPTQDIRGFDAATRLPGFGARGKEVALIAAIVVVLLILVFWTWLWRIAAVATCIGIGAMAVWLITTASKY